MLALLDRPTVGDSTCVIPDGNTVLEAGMNGGNTLGPPGGRFYNGPNAELRWGLPGQTELVWLPPNFQYQQTNAGSAMPPAYAHGFGATTVGIKHALGHTAHWQWTVEGLATLPSGNHIYGSRGLGGAFNGIVSYGLGRFGASLMLGLTSQTQAIAAGGQRYQSFNPDFVATWLAMPKLQFYAEVYAQTHTGHGQGWGCDSDGGVQYLVTRNLEVDLEEGRRLQGNLGGFTDYTGIGLGIMF